MTYYEVLEVGENSSSEVISAAYKALAKKYHPDVNLNPNADSIMKRINEAFDVLSDPDKRAKYGEYLRTQRQRAADEEQAWQEAEAQQKAEYARAEQAWKAAEEKAREAAEARRQQQENCYKKAVELSKRKHLGIKNYLAIAELLNRPVNFPMHKCRLILLGASHKRNLLKSSLFSAVSIYLYFLLPLS